MNKTIVDVANEYVTQDNRGTAFPIAFICIEKERIYREDGNNLEIYYDTEATTFDGYQDKELLEMVLDYNEEEKHEEIKEDFKDICCGYDLEEFIEKHYSDEAEVRYYDLEYNYKGKQMFLTESSAKAHIRMNGHNMNNATDYGIHVFRNIDMEIVIQDLMKKATVPQGKWTDEARRYFKYHELDKELKLNE